MPLQEQDLFLGQVDKIHSAIARLRQFEPPEGYYLAFSGGKDSIVLKKLAQMAKVKFDVHYSVTTIDPPDLIYFMKRHHPDVIFDFPEKPLLAMIPVHGFPLPHSRWCCEDYKERGGDGRMVLTGIRWAESQRRKKRQMVETCWNKPSKRFVHPIIDWTNAEIWEFIEKEKLPYCDMYDRGWKRLGCLMCCYAPQKQRIRESKLYPRYTQAFLKAFCKLYQRRSDNGKPAIQRWKSGEEMFWWWLGTKGSAPNPDQTVMFE